MFSNFVRRVGASGLSLGRAKRTFSSGSAAGGGGGKGKSVLSYSFGTAAEAQSAVEAAATAAEDAVVVEVAVQDVPLSKALPNLPAATYAEPPKTDPFQTQLTTLPSGLRVASEAHFGEFCTIGVLIDAGSRYEVAYPSGVSHLLEKLAFNSTASFSSRDALYEQLERYGGLCDAQSTRDTFAYAASCHVSGYDTVLGIIADSVLRPRLTPHELEMAREVVRFDVEDMHRRPECEPILTDWIHTAAFRNNTLGLAKFCPEENVDKITREMIFAFMRTHFTPSRIVVAGVGVEHEKLVDCARRYFDEKPPVWADDPSLCGGLDTKVDASVAQYTGGMLTLDKDLSDVSLGPTPYPELAHFVLGMESCSFTDPDFVAVCVLNSMMGGGGSFSAGGPGKGMYTRLYLDVLNNYAWMYNATSYNHAYTDTGLYCIQASANPRELADVANVIVGQMLAMGDPCNADELARAKMQLQSMLMMNLEQRPVMFEDVGRQVLGHGYRKSPLEYMDMIKSVTVEDISRVTERLLSGRSSVVGYGKLDALPSYEQIDKAIATRDIKELAARKSYSFFRR